MADSVGRVTILIVQGIFIWIISTIPKQKGALYNGVRAGILVYYTLFPLSINILYIFSKSAQNEILSQKGLYEIVNEDYLDMFLVLLLVCIFTFLMSMSYSSNKTIHFRIGTTCRNSVGKLTLDRDLKRGFVSKLGLAGDAFLLIGGFCTLYYALSFGNISRALALAGWVRGFVSATNYISYFASILIIPGGLVVLSPFCYLLSADYSKSIWRRMKFIASFLMGMLFLFIRAGRAPLLIYVLGFCMPMAIKLFRHPWRILCVCALIGMPMLDYLEFLFGSGDFVFQYDIVGTLSQFLYPYRTALQCFDIVDDFGIRWGKDFITTFVGLLPGVNFDTTWEVVSEYFGGSEWKTTGSTPSDLITFCVLELHAFGVLLGAVFGRISRHVDQACKAYLQNDMMLSNYGVLSVSSYITLIGFWYVSTADFDSVVRYMYYLGMCVVLILTTKRRSIRS